MIVLPLQLFLVTTLGIDGIGLPYRYVELRAHTDFAPIPQLETELWDQASSITVFVQALQNYYRL